VRLGSSWKWEKSGPGEAALFLAAATALVFGAFLNPFHPQVLSLEGEDLTGQFVWWRQFGFDQLRQGHLALWNPHLFSGAPFLGGFQSALLYPPNWLFMILPLGTAINLTIALHVFLAGFFTYLWARFQGFHPAAGFLAALMFMFGGSYFLHIVPGHLPNLCTMVWIPLVFLALDGWTRDPSRGWILLGAGALALEILAGHIQYFYYTLLVMGFYLLAQWPGAARKAAWLAGPAAMVGGAGLLALPQLTAGWEATHESVRSLALPMDLIASNDLMPERVWSWWAPWFYGTAIHHDYWGGGMYWEGSLFVSVAGAALALYGLLSSKAPGRWRVAGLGFFILLLAMGRRTPLYPFFFHFVPFFKDFRGAAKFNIFISLWVCWLAAAGFDFYLRQPGKSRGLALWTARFSLLVLGLGLLFHFAPRMGLGGLFGKFGNHAPGMVAALVFCAGSLALTALAAWAGARADRWRYALLALAFLELVFFARANRGGFDLTALEKKTAGLQALYDKDPGDYRVTAEPSNAALGTKGFDVWGNDPMIPGRYALFMAASQKMDAGEHFVDKPFFRSYPKVLGMVRLRYVLKDRGDSYSVQRLSLPEQPRVSLVGQWEALSGDAALARLMDPQFNFLREALVETDPGFSPRPGPLAGRVKLTDLSTDALEITADNDRPCLLVLGDNYDPNWRAQALEGDAQGGYQVIVADFFERGIALKAGHHHFKLEYEPRGFRWALGMALGSLALYLFFLARWVRRRMEGFRA